MSVIGLRVGPFEIAAHASVPEDGSWYIARRTGLTTRQPHEVLVKLLRPDATNPERVSLQAEFETLRSLDDPRVPAPVAYYEGTGALAITAVRGTPLSAMLDDRRAGDLAMTPATLLDLALEVAEVLQHAHLRGRVHGHLTAGSVLLSPDGRVWAFGFGPGPEVTPSERWMPPERARGDAATPATDQWALGALIASLVTGHPPWRGEDPGREALRGAPDATIGPVEEQWPALGRLLRRLMDPMPANRFPALGPVRQEVLALGRKAGGTSDRRELGALLHERHAPPPAPVLPPETGPHSIPEFSLPTEDEDTEPQGTEDTTTPPEAEETEPVEVVVDEAPPRRPARVLPSEAMPVVRPDLSTQVPELPTAVLGAEEAHERASTDADLEPSVSAPVRLILPAGALAGADPHEELEATLVIDTRELLAAALAAAEARDPAQAMPRGDARLVLDPGDGTRDEDEITATFGARIHLDATALLEAAGEGAELEEATVVIDAHGLADVLASVREADEATVAIDGSAIVRALVEAARRAPAEVPDPGEPEATVALDVAGEAVLVAEVQVESTDADLEDPAPGHPQVDDGEEEPAPRGSRTSITVVPPSDAIEEHITEDDIPFHDQVEIERHVAEADTDPSIQRPLLDEPRPSAITRLAPWLVVVMVGLMILFAIWQLVT